MRKKLSIAIGLLLVAGLLFVGVGGSTLSAGPANDTTAFSSGAGAKPKHKAAHAQLPVYHKWEVSTQLTYALPFANCSA